MNSNERKLWKYIAKSMKHRGHFSRVESHDTSVGIPDVNYCLDGIEGHLELKYAHTKGDGLTLRASQNSWFTSRVEAGGYPLLLAWVASDQQYMLISGEQVITLGGSKNVERWREKAKRIWTGRIDWSQFEWELTHPWSKTQHGKAKAILGPGCT